MWCACSRFQPCPPQPAACRLAVLSTWLVIPPSQLPQPSSQRLQCSCLPSSGRLVRRRCQSCCHSRLLCRGSFSRRPVPSLHHLQVNLWNTLAAREHGVLWLLVAAVFYNFSIQYKHNACYRNSLQHPSAWLSHMHTLLKYGILLLWTVTADYITLWCV